MRAILAKYKTTPLSWGGSNASSGRFHRQGQPTLYFAEDADTITRELPSTSFKNYQYLTFPADITLSKVLDFNKKDHQTFMGPILNFMRAEWAFFVDIHGQKPVTHIVSDVARRHGFEAIRFESRVNDKFNLAVFPKNLVAGSHIRIKDIQDGQEPVEMTCDNLHLFES